VCEDVTSYAPDPDAFALVLISYLQVGRAEHRLVLGHTAQALATCGELFMVGHALRNVTEVIGGPQDPLVLWDPDEIADELRAGPLRRVPGARPV